MRRIVLVNDEQTAPPGVSGTRTSELLLFEQSRLCDRGLCLLVSAVTRSIVYHRSHFLSLNFYLYTESNEYRALTSKSARPASSTHDGRTAQTVESLRTRGRTSAFSADMYD